MKRGRTVVRTGRGKGKHEVQAAPVPPDPSVVLALDLATSTGWAVLRVKNGTIRSGARSFEAGRVQGAGARFLLFRRWLDEMLQEWAFDVVYFEEVRGHVATQAAQVYGGFLATLTAWCEEREIPYLGVHTGTWKKTITGAGNAKKDQVRACIAERLELDPQPKHDEADALGVLLHATDRFDDGEIRHVRAGRTR